MQLQDPHPLLTSSLVLLSLLFLHNRTCCSSRHAGLVLQELRAAAPDPASATPMPYAGRLQELLAGDPYLQQCGGEGAVADAASASSVAAGGVKLLVRAIKAQLNF